MAGKSPPSTMVVRIVRNRPTEVTVFSITIYMTTIFATSAVFPNAYRGQGGEAGNKARAKKSDQQDALRHAQPEALPRLGELNDQHEEACHSDNQRGPQFSQLWISNRDIRIQDQQKQDEDRKGDLGADACGRC